MPSISSDARFLGIDFHALWVDMRKSWQGMRQWPGLAWLTPSLPVRLLQADGNESHWLAGIERSGGGVPRRIRFVAIELPEQLVLRRNFSLPSMAEQEIAHAVALDVRSVSPFAVEDLVWGYHATSSRGVVRKVEVALASRKQVAMYIATQAARLHEEQMPEVWVRTAGVPLIFSGYGEARRIEYAARRRRVGYSLLMMIAGLLLAIGMTPTAQLRLRAIKAVHSYDQIVQRTAPLVRQREMLLQSAEQLAALAEVLAGRIEPLRLFNKLTQVLPDDTSLQSFKLQGAKVTIVGLTSNASTLMQILGDQAGLRDVRAPSAATRIPGATKESFVIEFSLDPQLYGVVAAPTARPMPMSVPNASALPASTPGSAASRAPQAERSPESKATFGGGATFGGSPTQPALQKAVPQSASGPLPATPTARPRSAP